MLVPEENLMGQMANVISVTENQLHTKASMLTILISNLT